MPLGKAGGNQYVELRLLQPYYLLLTHFVLAHIPAAASFFALAYTFVEGGHIRITLFLEKLSGTKKKFIETWCLSIASFFSGYLAFYFVKMLIISYKFQERSEGADEILIWIPQTSVAIGSTIFFISVFHQFILTIKKD